MNSEDLKQCDQKALSQKIPSKRLNSNSDSLSSPRQDTFDQHSSSLSQRSSLNEDSIRALAESSDDNLLEDHSASPSRKKHMICETVLFFLPTVLELGFIGYGVGLCCIEKTAQGATIIGIFFCFLIATIIVQCYFYKRDGYPFRQDFSNSEEQRIGIQESNTPTRA